MTEAVGVPLRDQQVTFPVTPEQAVIANREHRTRLMATVGGFGADEWGQLSRCTEWTVQDVVRHLVDINGILLDAMAAARADERYTFFSTFNPKASPSERLRAGAGEPAGATLDAFTRTSERFIAEVDALAEAGADLLVATPVGRSPWHRGVLHGLFDSAVHERDVLVPLGRKPDPAPSETETTAIAAYQALLVARALAFVGAPLDLGLRLTGGPDLRVRVAGADVSVELDGAGTIQASGECTAVLDAMAGRGDLADAVSGPPEALLALSALRSLL